MSHRKYEEPRHGSLAFLPRKRAARHRGRCKAFPKDDPKKPVHLTAVMGYKAGMTHIVRDLDRPGSKMHKREVVEAVTVIETPPMVVVGVVGYVETPRGLRSLTTVWAEHLSDEVKRRFYKNWYRSKKKAFTRYAAKHTENSGASITRELERIKKYCTVVRVLVHTQISKTGLQQKKAHLMEIQVNGGSVADKVDFAKSHFEKTVDVTVMVSRVSPPDGVPPDSPERPTVVSEKSLVSVHGILPRSCSLSPVLVNEATTLVHPSTTSRSRVDGMMLTLGRIYRIANGSSESSGSTEFDLTKKSITPMGGFVRYGIVKNDFIMVKGTCVGPVKRIVTLRKALRTHTSRAHTEKVSLKFIDTSSNFGHGRFQDAAEKNTFLGQLKIKST
ncbi:hypothetical protein L204_102506 [Cryptococcus depauperatus]